MSRIYLRLEMGRVLSDSGRVCEENSDGWGLQVLLFVLEGERAGSEALQEEQEAWNRIEGSMQLGKLFRSTGALVASLEWV